MLQEAEALLTSIDIEQVADNVFFCMDAIDLDTCWERSGRTRYGYVHPDEAALELVEEAMGPYEQQLKGYRQMGMEPQALDYLKGMVLGLYRFETSSASEFREYFEELGEGAAWSLVQSGKVTPEDKQQLREFLAADCPEWADLLD